mmetsp:Transcript_12257/g.29211  ORF Transcript_12257/g.29211 Transcript_12257/m.29211 type:complete len:212 (-) Transcript_12257:51-686(-)
MISFLRLVMPRRACSDTTGLVRRTCSLRWTEVLDWVLSDAACVEACDSRSCCCVRARSLVANSVIANSSGSDVCTAWGATRLWPWGGSVDDNSVIEQVTTSRHFSAPWLCSSGSIAPPFFNPPFFMHTLSSPSSCTSSNSILRSFAALLSDPLAFVTSFSNAPSFMPPVDDPPFLARSVSSTCSIAPCGTVLLSFPPPWSRSEDSRRTSFR